MTHPRNTQEIRGRGETGICALTINREKILTRLGKGFLHASLELVFNKKGKLQGSGLGEASGSL